MYILTIKITVFLSVVMLPIIVIVADDSKDIDENCSTSTVHKRAKVGNNFSRRGSWLEPVELGGLSKITERRRRVRDQFNFYNIRPQGNQQQSPQQYQQQYQPTYDDSEDLYQQPNYPPPSPQPPNQPYVYPPAQQNTYPPPYVSPPYYPPQPYPYSPQPQQQPYPYSNPYPYPYPQPPQSTTTTTTPAPASSPIGYMLIDTYTSKFGSYSKPTAFFMNSR